ncbi:sugar ABC transporter substrate-binding protein [Tessaracoccus antarcticus]|uniref:Sugar ABC transporter substrate-binding protein n=2 Tax=Tessaracoccus antarcticus TaxID=2479848 RepID=A0A3M0G496_9ACTN|nr:sugar ABC transporter substrate-binding protein [Tessaracoccus antarcticus]
MGAPKWALVGLSMVLMAGFAGCTPDDQEPVTIGLITKQENNPYWVTMRRVAEDVAKSEGVTLLTATGTSDTDIDSEVNAIEAMVDEGVDGILIAGTDSKGVVPAIEAARAKGITVIAVDTPVDPLSAVDAFYATDNKRAGEMVGQYAAAKAKELGLEPQVAILDLAPGISSGELRREGFLAGFGIADDDPVIVGSTDTSGDRELGKVAMVQLLAQTPGINVVYTVNEPVALGAVEALKDAGVDLGGVVVVSVDGGCEAIKTAVRPGDIDATAQQYPQNMARKGVTAIADEVRGGEKPSGYLDTGVELITGDPAPGVTSRDVAFGIRNCWGG